jgi:hypothetical protein
MRACLIAQNKYENILYIRNHTAHEKVCLYVYTIHTVLLRTQGFRKWSIPSLFTVVNSVLIRANTVHQDKCFGLYIRRYSQQTNNGHLKLWFSTPNVTLWSVQCMLKTAWSSMRTCTCMCLHMWGHSSNRPVRWPVMHRSVCFAIYVYIYIYIYIYIYSPVLKLHARQHTPHA